MPITPTRLLNNYLLVVVLMFAPQQALPSESALLAGETALVLGRATVTHSDGKTSAVKRGMDIRVGDRIETWSNGHVHVRFVDDALLSIRPNSVFEIDEYIFNSDNPKSSTIKFNLVEGVARTISGDGAKAARDRFRLNTPVAAIGVRGTDFVVSAEPQATRALVNEGAIVIAPLSGTCLAESLGPCAGDALELTGANFQLASLQSDDLIPRVLSSQNLRAPGAIQRQLQLLSSPPSSPPPSSSVADVKEGESSSFNLSNDVLLEGVTSPGVRSGAQVAVDKVTSTDFVPIDPITVSIDGQVQDFDYTPPSLMTQKSLEDRQLVWGRYLSSPLLTDRLALDFDEASDSRRVSIGNTTYGLFRKDADPRRVAADLGLVGFQLTSAQAIFNSQTGIAVMRVDGGTLNINFPESSFETVLSLGHELTGNIEFAAAGKIYDGGFFRAIESTQRIAGAVSYDGSEAGYLFEKQIGDGLLTGLTLWDSK